MAVQKLPVPDGVLSPGSMGAGNTISDPAGHKLAMALPGSESVNPIPDRVDNVGLPELPADQVPLSTQAAKNHLPAAAGNTGGGWTTGVQPGGLQGHGNPGAGPSGPDLWKPTPSS